jgi:NHLM bacteriocin system ABC transporter ATP-binding protein
MKGDHTGKIIAIQGDKPLLLSNPDKVWLVTAGELNVFTIPVDGEEYGERDYLFTARQGTLLFGIAKTPLFEGPAEETEDGAYALLASASPGVQAQQLELTDVIREMNQDEASLVEGVRQWFQTADKYFQTELGAQFESWLQSGVSLPEKQAGLTRLNGEILTAAVKLRLHRQAAFRERILLRNQNREQLMRVSLRSMAGSVDPGKDQTVYEVFGNPLYEACLRVAQSRRIELNPPAELAAKMGAAVTLDEIVKVSNVNTREVLLENRWWQKDIGSLLGYMKEDGRPVAIVAVNCYSYVIDDPTTGKRFKATAKTAAILKPQAVLFYRPFPDKKLTLKDIAIFGYESIWKLDILVFVGIGLLGTVFGMITPKVTEILFNQIIPEGSNLLLAQLALIYWIVLQSKVALEVSSSFATLRMEGHAESSLEAAVMDRLTKLPVPFFKNYTTGDLTNRINSISAIRGIISGSLLNAVISGIFGVTYLVMLFYYSMQLTLIAVLMVAVALGINLWANLHSLKYAKLQQVSDNQIYGQVFESISGISKFRSAGAEERAFSRWGLAFSKNIELKGKNSNFQTMVEVLNTTITTVFSIVFYFMLVHQKYDLPLGKFTAFQSAFAVFSSSALGLMKTFIDANRVVPLYEMAKPILETLPEYDTEKPHPGTLKGAIEVKHVNFRYHNDAPLTLKDVSLQIHEGEYVGIVGPSGSGKSTLFRILLGFEKPETGQVYYDGKDLGSVDVKAVRRQFGVVLQNAHVMTGSIFSNIVGSNFHLTMKDAEESLRMAGLEEDIKQMPMGMHTVVPDGGGALSGGQRQRLVIARAMVNKPKILFFDEATSALDNRTQEIVCRSMEGLKATRVVIAHRLSTIFNCDRIIVMKDGRIIEEGTYQELMTKAGFFVEMAQRQLA